MNEFIDVIKNRRSIRKFKPDSVDEDQINTILDAGRWAPSLANTQPWEFIVVKEQELKDKLVIGTAHDFISHAPVSIIVTVNPQIDTLHFIESGALATHNMALTAHSLGLSSCWIGVFNTNIENKIKDILSIPAHLRVISILPVGYAAEKPVKSRKELKDLVNYETYGQKKK